MHFVVFTISKFTMGFNNSLKRQFRPSPDVVELGEVSHGLDIQQTEEQRNTTDVDLETMKQGHHQPVESGVARVEAVQAVWGNHGRYFIIAGLVSPHHGFNIY